LFRQEATSFLFCRARFISLLQQQNHHQSLYSPPLYTPVSCPHLSKAQKLKTFDRIFYRGLTQAEPGQSLFFHFWDKSAHYWSFSAHYQHMRRAKDGPDIKEKSPGGASFILGLVSRQRGNGVFKPFMSSSFSSMPTPAKQGRSNILIDISTNSVPVFRITEKTGE